MVRMNILIIALAVNKFKLENGLSSVTDTFRVLGSILMAVDNNFLVILKVK